MLSDSKFMQLLLLPMLLMWMKNLLPFTPASGREPCRRVPTRRRGAARLPLHQCPLVLVLVFPNHFLLLLFLLSPNPTNGRDPPLSPCATRATLQVDRPPPSGGSSARSSSKASSRPSARSASTDRSSSAGAAVGGGRSAAAGLFGVDEGSDRGSDDWDGGGGGDEAAELPGMADAEAAAAAVADDRRRTKPMEVNAARPRRPSQLMASPDLDPRGLTDAEARIRDQQPGAQRRASSALLEAVRRQRPSCPL